MPTLTANLSASGYGRSASENQSVTTDNGWDIGPVSVNAAVAGTISVRTDANTATATLGAGHGIATGDKVDVYWTGGSARRFTVGTVAGNDVPIDLGVGDALPLVSVAVTVCKVREEGAQAIVHTAIAGVILTAGQFATTFVFLTSANAELLAVVLPAGQSFIWTDQTGIANPFSAGTVAKVSMTHAGTAAQPTGGAVYYN